MFMASTQFNVVRTVLTLPILAIEALFHNGTYLTWGVLHHHGARRQEVKQDWRGGEVV